MTQSSGPRLPSVLLAVLGCILIGIAVFTAYDRIVFLRNAAEGDGVVVSLNAGSAHANVELTTLRGQQIQFSANGWISYRVHDRVRVVYDPEDPERTACVNDAGALWFAPSFVGGLGLFAWLLSALTATKLRRIFVSNLD